MPKPQITRFSSIDVSPVVSNKNNGLYAPQLTTAQRDAIPVSVRRVGGIIYNTDVTMYQLYTAAGWVNFNPAANGDVEGPAGAEPGHIAIFNGGTGKIIQDSGVNIADVQLIPLLEKKAKKLGSLEAPNDTVKQIGNLGYIQFSAENNTYGGIYVGGLSPMEFYEREISGPDFQVCTLLTGELPGTGNSSPSALLELKTTTGALLLSRLTQAEVDALTSPQNGMIVYNSDTNQFMARQNGAWNSFYGPGNPTTIIDTSGTINNLGIGKNALQNNSSGHNNIGIGFYALYENDDGSRNVGIGEGVLNNNQHGSDNVALGYYALEDTTASNNIGIGAGAFSSNNSGHDNIGIGYNTTVGSNNLTNAIAIGSNTVVDTSNAMVLGTGCNVGIGENSPAYSLHLGTGNSSVPLIYMASTNVPSTPATANDGIYSVHSGKPTFTSGTAQYQGTIATAKTTGSAATAGIVTKLDGTTGVAVNTTAVNANSLIFVNHIHVPSEYNYTKVGTLVTGSVVNNTSFVIYSSNSFDTELEAAWFIVNP